MSIAKVIEISASSARHGFVERPFERPAFGAGGKETT